MNDLQLHWTEIEKILTGSGGHLEQMMDDLRDYFFEQCKPGSGLDPRPTNSKNDGEAVTANRLYRNTAIALAEKGLIFAGLELLFHGWNQFNQIQRDTSRKIYKGIIALAITDIYYTFLKDMGAAARWALLTHADDFLVGHGEGTGVWRLRYSFGMSQESLSRFNEIVSSSSNLSRNERDWSEPAGFADDQVLKFVLGYPLYSHLFATPTLVPEFAPCIPYLKSLFELASGTDFSSTKDKGDVLEHLAAYLCLLIPGFLPRRKVIPGTKDAEYDLVVSNLRPLGNFEAELFGRDFLVECKNWDKKIGVNEVGYFLSRMRLTHTKFGIIFAKNGITGQGKKINAENLLQRAFHEDDALCIVFENRDIEDIVSAKTTFRSLLIEKANRLRFGEPH
jgi:hypothetical protein